MRTSMDLSLPSLVICTLINLKQSNKTFCSKFFKNGLLL